MFNKYVYKCDLLSIKPDIVVYNDKSMRKNVENAETEVAASILVKKTLNENYLREIVTNRLIPVYFVVTFNTPDFSFDGQTDNLPPRSPVFVKVHETHGYNGVVEEGDLIRATADEVKMYAFDHIDITKYQEKIEEIFRKGNEYYNNSKAKGVVSEETQIKRMLKAIKRCKKI